ncbi:hypothetical protein HD553DRAFT_323754 [Filobasidium floriforme]|uniref:uncharacterized protein n=1 Tax=Filobasidium floriforme TaxID=5210 RepID=UPI001E8D66F2|nr:uncharacterized protein HD553DRAFT_323754 [Filobasidium floriforme]KAH8085175.1 hypothetical protein HD553DRAFT_323754 [Filobasidium floriforme]
MTLAKQTLKENRPSRQACEISASLKLSFDRNEIYHELGNNVLITVNPGGIQAGTISSKSEEVLKEYMEKFLDRTLKSNRDDPNPSSLDNDQALLSSKMAYTIIATGVSGSGKTTILQHVLRLILGRDTNSITRVLSIVYPIMACSRTAAEYHRTKAVDVSAGLLDLKFLVTQFKVQ